MNELRNAATTPSEDLRSTAHGRPYVGRSRAGAPGPEVCDLERRVRGLDLLRQLRLAEERLERRERRVSTPSAEHRR